jgi:myo-inositol 2-dehydrogenase / D-chiro-inositol 1-dehydrogenase
MGLVRARAVKALGSLPAVFCDVDIERARQLASSMEPNAIVLADWHGIDFSAVDALVVCTPPFARGPLEQKAVELGLPIFIEKPVGLSSDQCAPVLRALDAKPTITAVGYMNRYRRSIADVIDRLRKRRIIGIAAYWVAAPYGVPWWGETDLSGGPLNDYATHLIDLARYFAGDIESVHAVATVITNSHEKRSEAGVVGMRFECDAVGSLIYGTLANTKSIAFDVIHDQGTLCLAGWDLRVLTETHAESPADPQDRDAVFFDEMKAFLNAVSAGSPGGILSDFRDAFRTQQVVDAIRRALSTGNVEKVC